MGDGKIEDLQAMIGFAHHLADISTGIALEHFRTSLEVENKSESLMFDPVTDADRGIESAIRKAISEHWPDHGIVGEEFEHKSGSSTYQWIIDPLDGTRAFVSGFPTWGTLIALSEIGSPILGLMSQPFTGERYWGTRQAAFYRGPDGKRQLKTRECSTLDNACFSTTSPDLFESPNERQVIHLLRSQARITRYGGDCYAYCLLAAGHIDLVVEVGLKAFDIAALVPIIVGAGGAVTSWSGLEPISGGQVIATGDHRLHEELLSTLQREAHE